MNFDMLRKYYLAIDARIADRIVPLGAKSIFLFYVINTYYSTDRLGSGELFVPWILVIFFLFAVELPRIPRGIRITFDVLVVIGLCFRDLLVVCKMTPWSL